MRAFTSTKLRTGTHRINARQSGHAEDNDGDDVEGHLHCLHRSETGPATQRVLGDRMKAQGSRPVVAVTGAGLGLAGLRRAVALLLQGGCGGGWQAAQERAAGLVPAATGVAGFATTATISCQSTSGPSSTCSTLWCSWRGGQSVEGTPQPWSQAQVVG